jgi:hypothetical protein
MGLVFIKKKMRKRSKDIIVVVSALKLIVWNGPNDKMFSSKSPYYHIRELNLKLEPYIFKLKSHP